MRKIVLLLSLFLTFFQFMSAQKVGRFEFELGVGGVYPISATWTPAFNGINHYGEIRYNFNNKFDIGLNLLCSSYYRNHTHENTIERLVDLSATVYCDYNWRKEDNYNGFVGIGSGIITAISDTDYYGGPGGQGAIGNGGRTICFSPRVGVELFDRVRLSYSPMIPYGGDEYIFSTISIGLAFGGKKK